MKRIYEKAALAVAGLGARRIVATLALSSVGATALVNYEGSVPVVYLDPVGIPTVCVGHTQSITRADVGKDFSGLCQQLLVRDTNEAQTSVRRSVAVPITQAQYDALVSFTFNIGGANLRSSTLLRKLNAGDCMGAGAEFLRWNRARGRVLPGLTKRRAAERAMFETGCRDEDHKDPRGTLPPGTQRVAYAHAALGRDTTVED